MRPGVTVCNISVKSCAITGKSKKVPGTGDNLRWRVLPSAAKRMLPEYVAAGADFYYPGIIGVGDTVMAGDVSIGTATGTGNDITAVFCLEDGFTNLLVGAANGFLPLYITGAVCFYKPV